MGSYLFVKTGREMLDEAGLEKFLCYPVPGEYVIKDILGEAEVDSFGVGER